MRPTISVNLGGWQFVFNDNAYRLMNEYLSSLSQALNAQELDTAELMADIESRCAEILCEQHDRLTYIITEGDVAALIDRMGKPEEIVDVDVETTPSGFTNVHVESHRVPPPYTGQQSPRIRKRLYRLDQGAEIGGVCGGLAAYCGWDPTYVRLATVALAFLSCSTVAIAYIIMWIVIPAAKTPLQQMELRGESPTLNNIGNSVKKFFGQTPSRNSDTVTAPYENLTSESKPPRAATGLSRFFSILAKIGLCLAGLICIVIVVALLGISLAGIGYGVYNLTSFQYLPPYFFTKLGVLICMTVLLGIPLIILIWNIIRVLFRPRRRWHINSTWRMIFLIMWCVALFSCIRLAKMVPNFPDQALF